MNRWLMSIALLVLLHSAGHAELGGQPDNSFLWDGEFSSIRVVDSFAIATNQRGILLAKLNNLTGRFEEQSHLFLPTEPFTGKVHGSVLSVRSEADIIYFVDISDLPQMGVLGHADLGELFFDYTLHDQSLYVADGFRGVRRYQLSAYRDPILVDSSLKGIHCVQVEAYGDELLVLDDYNGIYRYDLTGGGFGEYRNSLLIPRRPREFRKVGDVLAVSLEERQQLYFGEFGEFATGLLDSTDLIVDARRLLTIDTAVIAVDPANRLAEVRTFPDMQRSFLLLPPQVSIYADGGGYHQGVTAHIILPVDSGGPVAFNVDNSQVNPYPSQAYSRPGPITDFEFASGGIVTSGHDSPVEYFSVDSLAHVLPLSTIPIPISALDLESAGDYTLALFDPLDLVFVLQKQGNQEAIVASFTVNTETRAIRYFDPNPEDTLAALISIKPAGLVISSVSPSWQVTGVSVVNTLRPVKNAIVSDTLLLVQEGDFLVTGYKLSANLGVTPLWTIGGAGSIDCLTTATIPEFGGSGHEVVLAFDGKDMYRLQQNGPGLPEFDFQSALPLDVKAVSPGSNVLYTVGNEGIGALDLTVDPPGMTAYGGFPADKLKFDTDAQLLACSDGSVIDLYRIVDEAIKPEGSIDIAGQDKSLLEPNFPNPFNPSTTIAFEVPAPTHVNLSVINSLGRKVKVLVDKRLEAGNHEAVWDGRDYQGERVASGIYFYRLTTDTANETRKMVLLK